MKINLVEPHIHTPVAYIPILYWSFTSLTVNSASEGNPRKGKYISDILLASQFGLSPLWLGKRSSLEMHIASRCSSFTTFMTSGMLSFSRFESRENW